MRENALRSAAYLHSGEVPEQHSLNLGASTLNSMGHHAAMGGRDWEVALPYSPPCNPGDLQLGDYCYKIPRVQVPIDLGNSFNMAIGGLDAELLPMVASAIGPECQMVVQKSGDAFDLTLTSLQREHVDAINEKLGTKLA